MSVADPESGPATAAAPRFPRSLMHAAASLYYLEDATQAEIAERVGVSRATVSRLLSEARREGIVRIEVVAPPDDADLAALAERAAAALGLDAVHVRRPAPHDTVGRGLAPGLADALEGVALGPGDTLLVSSGRTVHEAAQGDLPRCPGVTVVPMIGGMDEPAAWYATNEIVRRVAEEVGGQPTFLYAPAIPAPEMHASLMRDPTARRVFDHWSSARCAIMGVGAPPTRRASLPGFAVEALGSLREAVGDVCSRFYDVEGRPIAWPGSDRLLATGLDVLPTIPTTIALAAGAEKVPSIRAGAKARYFNRLVTDVDTASALVARGD